MTAATRQFMQWSLVAALALPAMPALAGPGHDHGDSPPAASGNGPQRLPDGSVFIPKPAQRQMGVRTQPVVLQALARSHELAGKVVMDPNAGGRVQALVAGRLVPGPGGLPQVGQAVRKGQVLGYVEPANGALERSGQVAQIAELRAAKGLADKRLARLRDLADTVPRKEIEAAESDAASLAARMQALGAGLSSRDVLAAPVTGVVAASLAVAGQVVDARELLFEVVDPAQLRVEALAYEPALGQNVAGASLAVGGQRVPLAFVGAARSLREQALPLVFKGAGGQAVPLAIGQPVAVFVHEASTVQGWRVPSAALMKNPANQTIVWVKTGAEAFAPRVVTALPLDGASVAVTAGLAEGDRVATQAAALINQVR